MQYVLKLLFVIGLAEFPTTVTGFRRLRRRAGLRFALSRAVRAAGPQASAGGGFGTGEEGRVAERAARPRVAAEGRERRLVVRRRQQSGPAIAPPATTPAPPRTMG